MTYDDLYSAAKSRYFVTIIKNFKKNREIKKFIPELEELSYYNQKPEFHPEGITVWDHVIAALETYTGTDPIVKLAILFHDIGKSNTASGYDPETHPYYSFHDHQYTGVDLMDSVGSRLGFPKDVIDTIKYCIRNHMRTHKLLKMNPGKVRTLAQHKDWEILKEVSYCDDACRGPIVFDEERFNENMNHAEKLRQMNDREYEVYLKELKKN